MGEPGKSGAQREKPDIKGHILHDSIYAKCPDMVNLQSQRAVGSCQGVGWGVTWTQGSFWSHGNGLEGDRGGARITLSMSQNAMRLFALCYVTCTSI